MSPFRHRFAPHLGFRSLDGPLFRHSAGSADPVAQVLFAAEQGFAGILDPWHLSRPAADRARLAEALRGTGLAAGTLVCGRLNELRAPLWLPRTGAEQALLDQRLDEALTAAAQLGSSVIGVIAAPHPDLDPEAQEALLTETLSRAAPLAAAQGVTLAVEAINPAAVPGLLLTSYAQAERLVRRVGHRGLGLIYDSAHLLATDGDPVGHLVRTADIIAIVQIANHPGRTEPARGEIDMPALLRAVLATGYAGLIELEHVWAEDGLDAERAGLAWLRRIDATL